MIIEKENKTINYINEVLKDFVDFNCIGTTDNYENSMNLILKKTPSLVFLNLDNIIEDPFNFMVELNQFQEDIPEFIAISSSKEKAYTAIKNSFFDFYLNPMSELEIRKSILKFQKKKLTKRKRTICLKSYRDYQYLNTDDILFLKADNNTTDFKMVNGNTISAFKTLKTYEGILPNNFSRIHKSYIINKNYISRINYGKLNCSMNEYKESIPFTKTYIEKIKDMNQVLIHSSLPSLN